MKTNTLNMTDLSSAVAEKFGLTQQAGASVTNFIFDSIKDALVSGAQVRLHQFGTLTARDRAAGAARNPATGTKILLPARRVVKLTVSPALKKQIKEA